MTKWNNQTKSFSITFPKLSGVSANVTVVIVAASRESAVAQARAALHQTADQVESAVTVT
jgi:hypothetical protein